MLRKCSCSASRAVHRTENKRDRKMNEEQLKEFNRRIKPLKLDKSAKEEIYTKFSDRVNKGFKCAYCDEKMDIAFGTELSFTIDHIYPKSKGGPDTPENLEIVCRNCNFLKGEKNVDWFLANLDRLKKRKLNRELFKARKHPDDRIRESYENIFKLRAVR